MLDSHVLVAAVLDEKSPDRTVVEAILRICSRVVLSEEQRLERPGGEINQVLVRMGARPFSQSEVAERLDHAGKLTVLRASAHVRITDRQRRRAFARSGHRNVRDDLHLYEAALACRAAVITRDMNIDKARVRQATGVETFDVDDVVDDLGENGDP